MEIENILQELRYLKTGHFPREALEAAIAQREAVTPHLLQALENAPDLLERFDVETNYMLPLYAFYLLAQFRETRAYPLIVAFFSQPGELPADVTGSFVTEDLGRVLASVSDGNTAPMKTLIEDPQVNAYTRSAAMGGLITLFVEGVMTREAVITYFRKLFRGGLERTYSHAWNGLVSHSNRIYPEELLPEIQQAFADALVDEGFINLPGIKRVLNEGKAETLARLRADRHYHYVNDTIQELEWWACFQPPRPTPLAPPPKKNEVGRNDPCPCGSGRKYKHCCGKPG